MPAWHFVGGKGGVGKTTCAAALAIRAARRHRTLLVTTDPASSLTDVLGIRVDATPRRIPGGGRLAAANLDASAAFDKWIAPRRSLLASIALRGTYLDEEDVGRLLRLSLPGLDEIVGLLGVVQMAAADYDEVIVDTAPTGHTLRLLAAPSMFGSAARLLDALQAHHRQIVSAVRGEYIVDAADQLIAELDEDGAALVALLRDPASTRLSWVTHPEPMALEETSDALAALTAAGIRPRTLIVNRVLDLAPASCAWCTARRRFEARALAPLASRAGDLEMLALPDLPREPRGRAALARAAAAMKPLTFGRSLPPVARRVSVRLARRTPAPAHDLLPAVSWMLFGGKGGVGKTTSAAAYALDLCRSAPSHRVLLVSTDPAHSLEDVFGGLLDSSSLRASGAPRNLTVREIDAAVSFDDFRRRYAGFVDETFARVGAGPDAAGAMRQIMDMAPPGVDEVMAIADVAELLVDAPDAYDTIVSDTAPTGHVLRLLQTPALLKEWTQALMAILLKYREVVPAGPLASLLVQLSKRLRALEARLHDPGQTRFVLVTRPASLPRKETIRLRAALEQLKVDVAGVVINAAGAGTCRACRSRARAQADEIAALRQGLGRRARYAIIEAPAVMPPPHGARALSAWATTWQRLD